MGKVFKGILVAAVVVGAAVLTGGISIGPTIAGAGAASGFAITTGGWLAIAAAASSVMGGIQAQLAKVPRAALGQLDRLNASINPGAPRTMVLGSTALGTDIRYVEPSGTDQEYLDYIIGVACHEVSAIDEIWIEDRKAWDSASGVTSDFTGYLTVATRLEGTSANTIAINGGAKWGSTRRLTGCAYVHMRIKRTGNSKKAESPFASGLASRITIRGDGMPLYDPRQDSSVTGGSGSHDPADQTTWAFSSIGDNSALQILGYLLGWRIDGVLSVGCGVPPARIDLESFITAANLCDEAVSLAAGGTEPRYRSACVISENDDPAAALQVLLAACNGRLRDDGGRLSLAIMHNDLASAELDDGLGDDDVVGAFSWESDPDLASSFNVVRGKRTDPSDASLYQPIEYPEVRLASVDGIDRILTLNLLAVESASQAQRIAKQALQRKQYDRRFTATFSNRAWKYRIGDIVPLTFSPLGFDRVLMRVESQVVTYDGTCPMVLTYEHEDIYAWDASDAAPVTAAAPTIYDPLNDPLIQGIGEANAAIETIADDGILDRSEKPAIVKEYAAILAEQTGIGARATAQGITTEKTTYDTAVSALTTYLTGLSPAYNSYTTDTAITRATFIGKFNDVYVARQALLNRIDKSAYDNAASALLAATLAQAAIDVVTADNYLDKSEKPEVVRLYNEILAEQTGIGAQATAYGITTQKTTYDTAVSALTTYLTGLSPAYNSYTTDTVIVRATFITKFNDVYAARQAVLNKIDEIAGTKATWTGIPSSGGGPSGSDVAGTVNSGGGVATNKVATPAIINNSVSQTTMQTMGAALTGSGAYAWQDAISYTLSMPYAGDAIIVGDLGQGYSSGTLPQSWETRILVNGSAISTKGGAGWGTDSAGISGAATGLAAGNHTIKLQWRGDNVNLQLLTATMTVTAPMK